MNREQLAASIDEGVGALGQTLPPGAADRIAALLEELARWGRRINLTAIREPPAMVSGHVLDSLAVRPAIVGTRVVDIGTGAGFPGLPLAIALPAIDFVLLDGNARKISFVRHAVATLGLDNVTAVQARAEDYEPGRGFDTVIARAVTSTAGLVALGAHLLNEGGVILALKGRRPTEELDALPDDWIYSVTELAVPGLEGRSRHLVALEKRVHA